MGLDMFFESKKVLSNKIKKESDLIQTLNDFPFTENEKQYLYDSSGVYIAEWCNLELYNLIKDIKLSGQQGHIKKIRLVTKNVIPEWEIITESFYWRKENAIHKWFVDNIQDGVDDCGSYPVSYQQLQDFIAALDKVLENKGNAANIMPTQGGFFFGGTEYDEWYYDGLKRTRKAFNRILKSKSFFSNWESFYWSSW